MRNATVEKLKKARGLIAKGWCQGVWAKTKGGRNVSPHDSRAVRFCALGACRRSSTRSSYFHTLSALVPDGGALAAFNDKKDTKRSDVIALFDWAIGIEMEGGL